VHPSSSLRRWASAANTCHTAPAPVCMGRREQYTADTAGGATTTHLLSDTCMVRHCSSWVPRDPQPGLAPPCSCMQATLPSAAHELISTQQAAAAQHQCLASACGRNCMACPTCKCLLLSNAQQAPVPLLLPSRVAAALVKLCGSAMAAACCCLQPAVHTLEPRLMCQARKQRWCCFIADAAQAPPNSSNSGMG
jgi:hypothetical protein